MTLEKLDKNVDIIKDLSTYPNQEDGLSAEELKARFDEGAKIIKEYLNDKVVPAVWELEARPDGSEAVRFTPQGLSAEQQAQARRNIGAAKYGEYSLYIGNDETGIESEISISAEHPALNEENLVDYGRVGFYETHNDAPVQLVNIADGTEENHAATVGQVVLTTPQTLTEAKKVQAKENIGASDFYHTGREKVGKTHDEITTEYIYGLYDALGLQGTTLAEVTYTDEAGVAHTLPIKEYVISTGERNTEGVFGERYTKDEHIKKPVYLIQSAIHGQERKTAFSVYRFICDLLNGHNVPKAFKDGAIIKVIPVVNPIGFDNFTGNNKPNKKVEYVPDKTKPNETAVRYDADGVNINRDFIARSNYVPQVETQTIINWLKQNNDAELFIDVHNSGTVNEIAAIFGAENSNVADMAKKTALRGIDRVIPYWRDVRKYSAVQAPDMYGNLDTREIIFAYTVSSNEELKSTAFYYATKTLGIPAIAVELSTYIGNYSEWDTGDEDNSTNTPPSGKKKYPADTIAAGAEAIGNILIEFYEHGDMSLQEGTPIYNGEALLNISAKTHTRYNGEV